MSNWAERVWYSGTRRIGSNEELLRWSVEKDGCVRMRVNFTVRDPAKHRNYFLLKDVATTLQFRTAGATLEAIAKINEVLDFLAKNGRWPNLS